MSGLARMCPAANRQGKGKEGCWEAVACCLKATILSLLAFALDSNLRAAHSSSSPPHFPFISLGNGLMSLPFNAEFPEKGKRGSWVWNSGKWQWLVLPPPVSFKLGFRQGQRSLQSPALHFLPHDC